MQSHGPLKSQKAEVKRKKVKMDTHPELPSGTSVLQTVGSSLYLVRVIEMG